MPFAILLIGAILVVVAFNNSMPALVQELEADVPGYFVWAIAIAAILGLGYIPGLRTPSRYLLALVMLVILLKGYPQILAGFQNFASNPSAGAASGAQGAANPTAAYTQTYAPAASTATASSGTSATATASQAASAANAIATNPLSPSSYLAALNVGGGFGGIV